MIRSLALTFSLAALLASGDGSASSPDAWAQHYRDVIRNCIAKSQLRNAKPEGDLLMFSDQVGTGLLLRGTPEGSRRPTMVLCIARRGNKGVEVQRVYDGIDIDRSMLPPAQK